MKSGSLRATPRPPNITTACGTSRSVTMRLPSPCIVDVGDRRQVGLRGQAAERAIDQPAGGRRIDVADDAELERVARKHAAHIAAHVVDGDLRDTFRACRCPGDRRDDPGNALAHQLWPAMSFGLVLCALQARDHLARARARPRKLSKRGLVSASREQVERLVLVLRQRPQGAADIIAGRAQLQLDRLALQPVLEGVGVEIAGAFVERLRPSSRRARPCRPGPARSRRGTRNSPRLAARSSRAPARTSMPPGLTMRSILVAAAGTREPRQHQRDKARRNERRRGSYGECALSRPTVLRARLPDQIAGDRTPFVEPLRCGVAHIIGGDGAQAVGPGLDLLDRLPVVSAAPYQRASVLWLSCA